MNKRLLVIFLLGFSSGLPLALLSSTLQAWFAITGSSILATGMLSLIGLPYAYRFLWGPLLDRYSLSSLGKRRSWILFTQICLLIGFNLLAWLSPTHSPKLIAALAFMLALVSATQDTAIDAHRTEYLPQKEYGLGASLAVVGYRLAMLMAGGMALIIAHHYGWPCTYRLMGFLMLIGMVTILCSREPSKASSAKPNMVEAFVAPLKELFSRPKIIPLVFFIIFYKLGEAFTTTTSGIIMPFLIQGLGFSLETIGYVNKLLGLSSILLGGVIAGFILLRYALFPVLLLFGLLQAFTNLLFVLLAFSGKNLSLLALAVVCDNFAAGMGSTALVTFFMRLVNKSFTATQFSLLVSLSTLPRIFSGPIAAGLQLYVGWIGLYQLSFILALVFLPFLFLIRAQTEEVHC